MHERKFEAESGVLHTMTMSCWVWFLLLMDVGSIIITTAVISITCSRFTVAPTCSAHVKRTELSRVSMMQLRNSLNLKVLLA
jgi:hypothetical protein